ncbi:MAG: MotA/TolQ/ExbB proton channel family protein [Elusimicrobiota bacterium]|jgi:biopolymer transport protein ExbB/TolQ
MFEYAAMKQMWANAWPVISILILCSIFSGAIMLERFFALRRIDFDRDWLLNRLRKHLTDRRADLAVAQCETLEKPIGGILAFLIDPPLEDRTAGRDHLMRLALRLIRTETAGMMHYVTVLGTIGSVSPFVGLFGTVVGIIHAFRAISENAGGGPAVVANGIAEALITTALGLFVAIPAVVSYNGFIRKIERITEDMELCAEEIIDLTGPRP